MAVFDEEPARKPVQHEIGQDLSALSVHELDERLELLRAEIERLVAAKARKTSSKTAAESFFKR
jgi:uncharacterized small protein (DUF1192 family)